MRLFRVFCPWDESTRQGRLAREVLGCVNAPGTSTRRSGWYTPYPECVANMLAEINQQIGDFWGGGCLGEEVAIIVAEVAPDEIGLPPEGVKFGDDPRFDLDEVWLPRPPRQYRILGVQEFRLEYQTGLREAALAVVDAIGLPRERS